MISWKIMNESAFADSRNLVRLLDFTRDFFKTGFACFKFYDRLLKLFDAEKNA